MNNRLGRLYDTQVMREFRDHLLIKALDEEFKRIDKDAEIWRALKPFKAPGTLRHPFEPFALTERS